MTTATGTELAIVDLATGEVRARWGSPEPLESTPPESVAKALADTREVIAHFRDVAGAYEDELRRRLKLKNRRRLTFGDWEIDSTPARARAWDADALEAALTELVADGTLRAGEISDVITREPHVVASAALRVRNGLTGDAQAELDGCWQWREKPRPLQIEHVAELTAGAATDSVPSPVLGGGDDESTEADSPPLAAAPNRPLAGGSAALTAAELFG